MSWLNKLSEGRHEASQGGCLSQEKGYLHSQAAF